MDLTRLPLRILRLTTLSIAATLLFTIACNSDSTPPPRTDRTQQDLHHALAELTITLTSLNEELRNRPPIQLIPTPEPAPNSTREIPGTTPTPSMSTVASVPIPTGPGICSRSPAIQDTILSTLRTTSCRIITDAELFRITKLSLPSKHKGKLLAQLKAGDLSGLVNLDYLFISGNYTIPTGTFTGAGITRLTIENTTLSPGAFDGILRLEELTLNGDYPLPARSFADISIEHISLEGVTLLPNTFDGMTSLKSLHYESLAAPRYNDKSEPLTPPLDEFPILTADPFALTAGTQTHLRQPHS